MGDLAGFMITALLDLAIGAAGGLAAAAWLRGHDRRKSPNQSR